MMMKAKSTTTRMAPMPMIRMNKMKVPPSNERMKILDARATTRAQISYDKLQSKTKRISSSSMMKDIKPNKRSSSTRKN